VAKVGNTKITTDAFKQSLAARFQQKDSYSEVDSAAKMNILNKMILDELKAKAGRKLGLAEEASYKQDLKMQKSRVFGNRYFEIVVVDKLFPEEVVRKISEKQKEQVHASHILLGFKGAQRSKATRTKEEAKKLAEELVIKAQKGEDFGTLAEKYSDDPSAKQNKGDLGYFVWGRMVESFQEAAYSMNPGDISDPVESPFGFHVIKLIDRNENPNFKPDGYETEKMTIKRQLYGTKKDSGMVLWNEHTAKLLEQYRFKLLTENIDKIVEAAKGKPKTLNTSDYSDEEKQLILAEWAGGKLSLNDLFMLYGQRVSMLAKKLTNSNTFQQEVKNASMQDLIIKDSEKMGIDDEPLISSQIEGMERARLAGLAEKQEVTDRIEINDDELMAYYTEHSQDFMRPAEMELWEVYVTDENLANKIARKAKAGSNFEKLATQYSEDKNYKKKKGYLGFKAEKHRGEITRKAFELGTNKIGGPVKFRSGWTVFKTGKMHEQTMRSFEDVKNQVNTKVRNIKLKDRREEWETELRDQFGITINYELVEKI